MDALDISKTIQANSEQVNADDLASPITVTITNVEKGTADQPVFVHLAEFPGRTFRPAKTVRRLLVAAWGTNAADYVGRRLTIYNDRTVKWAGQEIGGVRVSHMSGLDKPLSVQLSVSRGKRAPHVVQPLPDAPPAEDRAKTAINAITNAPSIPELDKLWARVVGGGLDRIPTVKCAFDERAKELAASQ
jgi:hypothetical protein